MRRMHTPRPARAPTRTCRAGGVGARPPPPKELKPAAQRPGQRRPGAADRVAVRLSCYAADRPGLKGQAGLWKARPSRAKAPFQGCLAAHTWLQPCARVVVRRAAKNS